MAGSCPAATNSRPDIRKTGTVSSPKAIETQSPIRVTRRSCASSPAPAAAATSGITAQANPVPSRNSTKNSAPPSTSAASSAMP